MNTLMLGNLTKTLSKRFGIMRGPGRQDSFREEIHLMGNMGTKPCSPCHCHPTSRITRSLEILMRDLVTHSKANPGVEAQVM